jgi:hypothetical protein
MKMMDDRLAFIRQAPELVERAVRAGVRETIAAKRLHDRTLAVRDIANIALGELDSMIACEPMRLDAVGRHELTDATVRAATRFATSPLARRLQRIPVARFIAAPHDADITLVDRHGYTHVVRIEAFEGDVERVAWMRAHVAGTSALRAPSVHFFSLRDGTLHSFGAPPVARTRRDASVAIPRHAA